MEKLCVGVLGGGQLGRMLIEAANRLNIEVIVLDGPNTPAKQISAIPEHPDGSFANAADVLKLDGMCDIITAEIEHVDTKILEEISRRSPEKVQPGWQTIRTIQDKYKQKEFLTKHQIPTAESTPVTAASPGDMEESIKKLGFPFMLKSRTGAYDGKGNFPVKSASKFHEACDALKDRPLYAEKWVDFRMELAVMVVKTVADSSPEAWETSTQAFPVVETVHEDSICKLTYTPARGISKKVAQSASKLARRAVAAFHGRGVFGVELFLLRDDSLLVNEIAPRPHNSGHYTIEACHMSQYEAHLRAVLPDLAPTIVPGATSLLTPNLASIMVNILGGLEPDSHFMPAHMAMKVPGAKVHLYGKGDGRPGRKMGHVTIVGASMNECEEKIQPIVKAVDWLRWERAIKKDRGTVLYGEPNLREAKETIRDASRPTPLVGVTMGSDSDLPVLKPGLQILDDFKIPYHLTITSAHRTPERMLKYAREAASRGLKVIIAAAGGAAHLPGMIASSTSLPVIGVPVKASTLDGMDSLLSIVQMPRGVPVAAVAINNSVNAALLAIRILGADDENIREQMDEYLKKMEREVEGKAVRLEDLGHEKYGNT